MIWVIIFLILWTSAGIWYFIANLGNKDGSEPWWAWLLMPPVLILASLIGFILKYVYPRS